MPIEFVDPDSLTGGSTFTQAPDLPSERDVKSPGLLAVTGAAFRSENIVGSMLYSDPFKIYEREEGYSALGDIEGTKYLERYSDRFTGSASPLQTERIKAQIDREEQDRKTIEDGGAMGTIMSMASGITDPTIALPGGAIYKSVKAGKAITKSAKSVGIAAGVETGVQEGILQSTQETRTAEESTIAIGSSVVLGGILGGAAGLLARKEFAKLADDVVDFNDVMEGAEREFAGFQSNSSAGAAQADLRSSRLKDEAFINKLSGINKQDPMIRGQLKKSRAARRATNDLAESPLEMVENADFVPTTLGGSVESRMKLWQGPLSESVDSLSNAFSRYYYGKQAGGFARATAPVRSEFSSGDKLTYTEFKREVGKALRREDRHEIPEVAETAKMFRSKVFEPGKQKAIEAGLLPENVTVRTADSYLTRIYNQEMIAARRGEFKAILTRHFEGEQQRAALFAVRDNVDKVKADKADEFSNLSKQEIEELVEDTIDQITGVQEGRIPYDLVQGPRGPLRERVLNIRDDLIEEFLESDVEAVARIYTRTMSADVELQTKFGSVDLKGKVDEITGEYRKMIEGAKTEKERATLGKERDEAIRDVEAIRDRLRGTYAMPNNPNGLMVRSGRVVRNLNYLRLLGGMTLSAIPDMAKVVFTHGLSRSINDGIRPMIRNVRRFNLARDEVKLAGTALDMTLDSRTMAIADIMDDYGRSSKFERSLSALSGKLGIVSLMAPWNAAMKQFSGAVVMTRMLKATEDLASGKLADADKRLLAASGIDEQLSESIGQMFKKHGSKDDGVYFANTSAWEDRSAVEAFRAAVVRDVDRVIVTPGQDKPLWMSTEMGKIVGQFKSFGVSSIQKTLLAGVQQRDAATFQGISMMLALGALTYAVKEKNAGREVSDDPKVWVGNAIDRSGLLGWLSDADAMAHKIAGYSPIGSMTKGVGRYRSRNVLGAALGPTADLVGDSLYAAGSISRGEFKGSDLRKLRRMAPLQNLFYTRKLLDEVESGAAGMMGLN